MIRDGARRLGGTDGALDPRSHRKHRRHPGGETAAGSWDHTDFASHCGLAHDRGCRSSSLPLGRGAPPAKTKKKKNGTACRGVMHFGRIVTSNGQDREFSDHSSRSAVVFQVSPFTKLGTVQIAHEDSTNFS